MQTTVRLPLNTLVPSPRNVRRTGGGKVADLKASIRAHGLLQCLVVEVVDGRNEVVAGGRRLRALNELAAEGHLRADDEVQCCVLPDGAAGEASLAENVIREPMHPADEFEAYRALVDGGMRADDIALHYGVSRTHVDQRLKLSNVAPDLVQIYRDDGMTLSQLMAFTVNDDHEAQRNVWKRGERNRHLREAYEIKSALTEGEINVAKDRRMLFVTVQAFEAEGGIIRRDLFSDGAGYTSDIELLDRLCQEKLEKKAAKVRKEGWGEVHVRLEYPSEIHSMNRIEPGYADLPPDAQREIDELAKQREALQAEIDKIEEVDADSLSEEQQEQESERLDDLYQQQRELDDREEEITRQHAKWTPETKGTCQTFVYLSEKGKVETERGLAPRAAAKQAERRNEAAKKAPPGATKKELDDAIGLEYSKALVTRLTAQRTAAMRIALARNPRVAKAALALALSTESQLGYMGTLKISVGQSQAQELQSHAVKESAAARQLDADQRRAVPVHEGVVCDLAWFMQRSDVELDQIIALFFAEAVDAVDVNGRGRSEDADALAKALDLDVSAWWQATRASCLDAMNKPQIIAALTEAGVSADQIEAAKGAKSGPLREMAEAELVARKWVPEVIRTPGFPAVPAAAEPQKAPKPQASAKPSKAPAKKAAAKPKGKPATKAPAKKAKRK